MSSNRYHIRLAGQPPKYVHYCMEPDTPQGYVLEVGKKEACVFAKSDAEQYINNINIPGLRLELEPVNQGQ